jgi:hypothetical protein
VSSRSARIGAVLGAALVVALAAAAASTAARPLKTAVFQAGLASDPDSATMLARIRAAGSSLVRIVVPWSRIAPAETGATFEAADPNDPSYSWDDLDGQVRTALANGLQPILTVTGNPGWARSGSSTGVGYPDTAQLGSFSHAVATRYSGRLPGLPRVRYWQLWNEPNLNTNLEPQFAGQRPVSPGIYRGMVNAFTKAVKGVSASNFVIVGGLAPYGIQQKGEPINDVLSVAPLRFMRELLCVSAGAKPRATCNTKVAFDAFSIHPYTWGDPTHTAYSSEDVAMGDLPEVTALLATAWKLGRIVAKAPPKLWVTEISWDTNPPDPKAVPMDLQTRWTSEALYRMWADGVEVITWFLIRDQTDGPFQSGLYFAGPTVAQDRPKPTLTAFRFPFVAFPQDGGTLVWGRVPESDRRAVVIERKTGSGWRQVARLQSDRVGIFQQVLPVTDTTGFLRARLVGASARSLPFGLADVPDRRISPFGT